MIDELTVEQADLNNLSDYSLQLNRWVLKPIGAWPMSFSKSKMEKCVSLILIVVCYFCILTTVVPCILYLMLDDDDIQRKLTMVGPLSHVLIGGINYTTLLLRGKEIRRCVEQQQTDWQAVKRSKEVRIMLRDVKFGRYMAAICIAFMQGGALSYCAMTSFTTETIQVGNETKTVRPLPCTAYKKLIPTDTSPTNEIILFVQFLGSFIVNSSTVGAFSLAITFAAHVYGQLDVLMMCTTEFVKEYRKRNKKTFTNEIQVVVKNHLRALNFISYIQDMMTELCFLEVFKCTFNICMLGYYILMQWANRDFHNLTSFVLIFCSMVFNIFTVCYIGEKLSEQCQKVGDAIYMTEWYHLPRKDILDLILIIVRSSVVTKISAGKFIHMSLYTFGCVMKTAFGYFNVLRQMT